MIPTCFYYFVNTSTILENSIKWDAFTKIVSPGFTVSSNKGIISSYNDLGRYVMFGVTWKFNTLSKKAAANIPTDGMPGERPMGPPPGAGERGTRSGGGPMGPPPGHM